MLCNGKIKYEIANRFDDISLKGLKRKGFEFETKELISFISIIALVKLITI